VWLDNLDFVHSHNQRGGSYWVRAPNACKLYHPFALGAAAEQGCAHLPFVRAA